MLTYFRQADGKTERLLRRVAKDRLEPGIRVDDGAGPVTDEDAVRRGLDGDAEERVAGDRGSLRVHDVSSAGEEPERRGEIRLPDIRFHCMVCTRHFPGEWTVRFSVRYFGAIIHRRPFESTPIVGARTPLGS